MDEMGINRIPFLFIVNFDKTQGFVSPLEDVPEEIMYEFHAPPGSKSNPNFELEKSPISPDSYRDQFEKVQKELKSGKASVINLTCATPLHTAASLEDLFHAASAKYKLYWKDHFTCFSPETFIKINNNTISTFPMKGTIDSSVSGAGEKILNDEKEIKEHTDVAQMMVDDLQKVANEVTISRFRYIEEIKTRDKTLLEVSSEITGNIKPKYRQKIGSILDQLLPAASICGRPRDAAMDIILLSEAHCRNYYTGVFGIFDGQSLDSAVLIRFIEKTTEGLVYKSGGGITLKSDWQMEYNEMIDKIYVPIH